jgi:hypothetical protein
MSNVNQKPEAEQVKGFFDSVEDTGFEGLGRDKFKNQFLGIAGGNHEGVVGSPEDKAKFGGKLEAGYIFNTATKQVYGKTIQVIVLKFDEIWVENEPGQGDNLGKFVGARAPGTGEYEGSPYKRGDERLRDKVSKNPLTPTELVYVLDANDIPSGVKCISFRGTGQALLKDWRTVMKAQAGPSGKPLPAYGGVWELETQFNKNKDGSWFSWGTADGSGPYTMNAKFIRRITDDEGYGFIAPERKILITAPTNYAQIAAGAEQTYLAAGSGTTDAAEDMGI